MTLFNINGIIFVMSIEQKKYNGRVVDQEKMKHGWLKSLQFIFKSSNIVHNFFLNTERKIRIKNVEKEIAETQSYINDKSKNYMVGFAIKDLEFEIQKLKEIGENTASYEMQFEEIKNTFIPQTLES